ADCGSVNGPGTLQRGAVARDFDTDQQRSVHSRAGKTKSGEAGRAICASGRSIARKHPATSAPNGQRTGKIDNSERAGFLCRDRSRGGRVGEISGIFTATASIASE